MANEHIADVDYKVFYSDFFENDTTYTDFYAKLKKCSNNAPKMFHQTARMIWLSDKIEQYTTYRPAIRLLFYLIVAELVSKLYDNFDGEGWSNKYIHSFFNDFCSDRNKAILNNSVYKKKVLLNLSDVIDYFYKIRCDIVHEGNYYKYSFKEDTDNNYNSNYDLPQEYKVNIRIAELRNIIIETSLTAVEKKMQNIS
jgi:hypothetical protein